MLALYQGLFFSHRLRTHVQHNLRQETEVAIFRGLNFLPTSLLLSSTVLTFCSASVDIYQVSGIMHYNLHRIPFEEFSTVFWNIPIDIDPMVVECQELCAFIIKDMKLLAHGSRLATSSFPVTIV